jgi:hypothetical protein
MRPANRHIATRGAGTIPAAGGGGNSSVATGFPWDFYALAAREAHGYNRPLGAGE